MREGRVVEGLKSLGVEKLQSASPVRRSAQPFLVLTFQPFPISTYPPSGDSVSICAYLCDPWLNFRLRSSACRAPSFVCFVVTL